MTAASWVQAGATVVLVAVTIAYVLITNRMTKSAQQTAAAAERALLLDIAPIIYPRRTVQPLGVSGSAHNLGGRPALEVALRVFLNDTKVFDHHETMMRPNEQKNWKFQYDPNQTGLPANAEFRIESDYQSLTGENFRTIKRYRPGQQNEFEVWHVGPDRSTRLVVSESREEAENA